MVKAIRKIEAKLKVLDVIIEVLDARSPFSTSNPIINTLIKNKIHIIIINKIDLADDNITLKWKEYFIKNNLKVILLNAKSLKIKNIIIKNIIDSMKEKVERYKIKGIVNYQIKVAILGIPNVGKSTIINSLAGKKVSQTGNKPGVTKGEQWINIGHNIYLLDTPGILWPKFNDKIVGLNLALIKSINLDILDKEEIVYYAISFLCKNFFNLFIKKYFVDLDIDNSYEAHKYVEILAEKYKLSNMKIIEQLFNDLINGKIGKISWEIPDEK